MTFEYMTDKQVIEKTIEIIEARVRERQEWINKMRKNKTGDHHTIVATEHENTRLSTIVMELKANISIF